MLPPAQRGPPPRRACRFAPIQPMGSQAPPWQQPLLLSREPRGPSPAHLRSSDSSTGSCRLGASSESRSRAYCGPRRAPGPSLHPPPGRMASLAAQMCEPGRGLPARGSAEGAQPEPLPVPSQHSSPAGQRCLPCSEGSTGGVGWEKAEGEEQGVWRIPDPQRPSTARTSPAAHPEAGPSYLRPRA